MWLPKKGNFTSESMDQWSSGMIPPLGGGGRAFDSLLIPFCIYCVVTDVHDGQWVRDYKWRLESMHVACQFRWFQCVSWYTHITDCSVAIRLQRCHAYVHRYHRWSLGHRKSKQCMHTNLGKHHDGIRKQICISLTFLSAVPSFPFTCRS